MAKIAEVVDRLVLHIEQSFGSNRKADKMVLEQQSRLDFDLGSSLTEVDS